MKTDTQKVIWFEKKPQKRKLTATINSDEKLRLSEELQKQLPEFVQYGFNPSERVLMIRGTDNTTYKKQKSNMVFGLVKQIKDTGMKLPVCFEFNYDNLESIWYGKVALRRINDEYDMEQVLALYKPLATKLFHRIGKSMPKEDRRQIIDLAFCQAAKEYTPAYGDLETYLFDKAKTLIKPENHLYVEDKMKKSLDASLTHDFNDSFSFYNIISNHDGCYEAVENSIAERQFEDTLSNNEIVLLTMLKQGCTIYEIADKLEKTDEEVEAMGKLVSYKRKKFF